MKSLSLIAALLLAPVLFGCSGGEGKKAGKREMPPAPVRVAAVVKKDVPQQLESVGTVEAYATIAVTSQINGQIAKIHFTEGAHVAAGGPLFSIDPRPFKASFDQASAALARDTVQWENAKKDAARIAALAREGYAAKADAEKAQTAADALGATVAADKAAAENARLQLEYCSIKSPINGVAGDVLIDVGNMVKANDKTMVTLLQVKPINAAFAVPQQSLDEVRGRMSSGKLKVSAAPSGGGDTVPGTLTFIDNGIDPSTGTIKMKAAFANGGETLVPGQFVKITVHLGTESGALTVPAHAVMTGQKGDYVFVVNGGKTAELRPVNVLRLFGGDAVIGKGLAEGESVVVDGQVQVIPGGPVKLIADAAKKEAQ